ncbi:ABC transporter substrate-binding protein [Pantoea sp. 18069]|uniref:ABC transporter substrate-binding protein n=1 Tax=Pantoea sp. 18069 TaxID=2681415 RepID=UPI00135A63C5|nr:ABC transporter substrate-binding protein [Pantoea sp. 18069]
MSSPRNTSDPHHLSRRAVLKTAITMATGAMASSIARARTPAPKILRYSDHEPFGGMRTRFLKDVFFPAIERESSGRLKIEAHWDGELAAAYDALGAAGKSPRVDMATAVPEYTANELPLHQIFKSFPVGPTGDKQVGFFRQVYRDVPEFSDELARNDVVPVYIGTGYPVSFFSKAPLDGLKGVAKGRWRTASFWHRDFLRSVGATPVSIPWGPQVNEAFGQGTLDGLMVNVDSGYILKVHEMAPNVLASRDLWLGHAYPVVMKKSVWNGLAAEDREAIQRAAERAYQTLGGVMDASFDVQIEDLRAAGARVRVVGREEALAWQVDTRYQQAQHAWAEQQTANGIHNARSVIDSVAAVLNASMK